MLGLDVAGAPVRADTDPEDPRRAPLSLCLADGVENHPAHPFQVTAGPKRIVGQAVLPPHVLAPSPLEHQGHPDRRIVPLLAEEPGESLPHVVAAVDAGDGIDGVVPEVLLPGCPGDRLLACLAQRPVGEPRRVAEEKHGHPRILAQGALHLPGKPHVLQKRSEDHLRRRPRRLFVVGQLECRLHVCGQFAGGPADEVEQRLAEGGSGYSLVIDACHVRGLRHSGLCFPITDSPSRKDDEFEPLTAPAGTASWAAAGRSRRGAGGG